MNQDAPATTAAQLSPTQGYISGGSDSKSSRSSMAQKRASRAGTRSVTTLSAAQLERKRANDREAQRAIRQRTKDHIETLERRINDMTVTHESREKMMAATRQRNRELEEENGYLRSRLGGETFAMSVAEVDSKDKSTDYGVAGAASSPQSSGTRTSPAATTRGMPMTSLHASQHPESWRSHGNFAPSGGPTPTPFLSEASQGPGGTHAVSWRAHEVGDSPQGRLEHSSRTFSSASGASDRGSWAGPATTYPYQVRPTDRTTGYSAVSQSMSYPAQSQSTQFQTVPAVAAELPPVSSTFHTPGLVPQGDYQQMPAYTTSPQSAFHDQSQPHAAYQVGHGQVQSAGDFSGSASNVQRNGLAPAPYNTAAPSPQFMHTQPSHGQGMPMAYREGPTQQQYGYDP